MDYGFLNRRTDSEDNEPEKEGDSTVLLVQDERTGLLAAYLVAHKGLAEHQQDWAVQAVVKDLDSWGGGTAGVRFS